MAELKRFRAGYYAGELGGRRVEIEWCKTGYGDSGWFYWIENERCDFPYSTLKAARQMLNHQLSNGGWRNHD